MTETRKITRQDFIEKFGMTPEEYKRQRPNSVILPQDRQQAAPKQTPTRREFNAAEYKRLLAEGEKQGQANFTKPDTGNEKAYQTDAERMWAEQDYTPNVLERGMNELMRPLEQGRKNAISGVLQLPTDMIGVVGLARIGLPALYKGLTDDDPNKGYGEAIGEAFVDGLLPKEKQASLQKHIDQVGKQYQRQNPNATDEEVTAYIEKYQDTDEYFEVFSEHLPPEFQITNAANTIANKWVGLGKRPDQQTAGDEIMQAVAQGFVGIPRSLATRIGTEAIKRLPEKLVQSRTAQIAGRTAEVLTPITMPLTPGNVALNAGAGAAITEGARYLGGDPTFLDYGQNEPEPVYDPEQAEAPEAFSLATGATLAGFLGLPAIRRALQKQAMSPMEQTVRQMEQKTDAAPTVEDQSTFTMEPNLSPITGLVDDNAPLVKGANLFGANTDTVDQLSALRSSASTVNRMEAENNALNYGILEGIPNTVPMTEINRSIDMLDDVERKLLDQYVAAVQRSQDVKINERSLMDEVTRAQTDLQAATVAGDRRRINSATKRYVDAQNRYRALQNDDPLSRPSVSQWSNSDVQNIISLGDSNAKIKQVTDAMRQVSRDITHYLYKNGVIDGEEAIRRMKTRPLYVPLWERAYPNVKNPFVRQALLFKDRVTARPDPNAGFYSQEIPRNVSGDGSKINKYRSANIALQEAVMDAVRTVTANNARREIIDKLRVLPNAEGKLLRKHMFSGPNGKKIHQMSQAQFTAQRRDGGSYAKDIESKRDQLIKISRNGKVEFWQFADPSLTKSLQFAPLATVPIFNETRKVWQFTTTGLAAPWFAAKTFAWDVPLARTTMRRGRSLGLIDTYARRLAQGTALERPVDALMDTLPDPTAFASAGLAIPYQIGMRAVRALGQKIASDLTHNSGVFAAIANSGPLGKRLVENTGTAMAQAFDQSAFAVMTKNLSTSLSHLNDAGRILDDYTSAARNTTGPVGHVFNMYRAMVESVQMATKTAFFAENYGRLLAKHNGKIPAKELRKLVQETRNLTGDMSRQSNSKIVQAATTVIPYSNPIIQGTRHILSAAVTDEMAKGANMLGGNMVADRQSKFWTQLIGGMVLPKLGAFALLSNWEGAEDYWFNQVPKWQQFSGIPLPNADTVREWYETGVMPKFTPERMNVLPVSPEFALIVEPMFAGLRAMGVIAKPNTTTPNDVATQMRDILDQVSGFATPPAIQAMFGLSNNRFDLHAMLTGQNPVQPVPEVAHGGANADMMTHNSDIPQWVYQTLGALLSSSAQIALQTLNVFDISQKDNGDFWDAAEDALDTAGFEIKRRFPNVDIPPLFDAVNRDYSFTPESQYVYEKKKELEPIIGPGRQLSVERDGKGRHDTQIQLGLVPAAKLRDPKLRQISEVIWDTIGKKGPYKEAQEAYTEIRAALASLEATRYKVPDAKYNEARNKLVRRQQAHTRTMSQELQKLEGDMQKAFGRRFAQEYGVPFNYKNLSELVRQDVAGQ